MLFARTVPLNELKVLLAGPVPPECGGGNRGGVARHLWSLAEALAEQGHEVHVVALGRYYLGSRRIGEVYIHGLSFHPFKAAKAALLCLLRRDLLLDAPQLRHALSVMYATFRFMLVDSIGEFDIVHVHGIYNGSVTACRILGAPASIVATIHSYTEVEHLSERNRPRIVRWYNRILSDVDATIHVSMSSQRRGHCLGINASSSDYVVYNGITVPSCRELGSERGGVCYVGNLIETKGVLHLISAWRQIACNQVLFLAGTGRLESTIRRMTESMNNVCLLGYLSAEDVRALMSKTYALVVPSFSESFGLVYIEALLQGTPVVGYHRIIEEFREVLKCTKSEESFLIPLDVNNVSVSEIGYAVKRAVEASRTDTQGLIAKSISMKVANMFAWSRTLNHVTSIYRSLAC